MSSITNSTEKIPKTALKQVLSTEMETEQDCELKKLVASSYFKNLVACSHFHLNSLTNLLDLLHDPKNTEIENYYDTLCPNKFQVSDNNEIEQERDDLDKIMEQHDGNMYGGLDNAEVLLVEQYEELLRIQFTEQDFADKYGAGHLQVYSSAPSHASTAVARSMLKQHLNKRKRKKRAQKFVYYIRGIACGGHFMTKMIHSATSP